MLWTACTAAYLAVVRLTSGGNLSFSSGGTFGLLAGPGIAALLVCPFWRRAGYRFPTHAGEWLLLISGAYAVLVTLLLLAEHALWGPIGESLLWDDEAFARYVTFGRVMICGMLMLLAVALACVAFAFLRERTAWRYFFFLVASLMLLVAISVVFPISWQFVTACWPWVIRSTALCAAVVLVIAVLHDLRGPERLPWTHWIGTAVFALQIGLLATPFVHS